MCKIPTILWIANARSPGSLGCSGQDNWWFAAYGTPTLGLAPPSHGIPRLRGWQKPLQDPTPVERGRTVTRMAGVLNHAHFTAPPRSKIQNRKSRISRGGDHRGRTPPL